jgi:hypothetical protein
MKCKEVIGKLNDRATVWVLACEEAEGKDKILPIASYEGLVQEHKRSSTLPLTLTLDAGGCVVNATPRPPYPRDMDPVRLLSVRWVGFGSGLEGRGNPHSDLNSGPSSR